jgi:hypothetical protein
MTASPHRARLPTRRPAITQDMIVGNTILSASIGFDETGQPAEIFLSGAKDGSGLAAILEDASVVISVALQHGIPARAGEECGAHPGDSRWAGREGGFPDRRCARPDRRARECLTAASPPAAPRLSAPLDAAGMRLPSTRIE